MIWKYQKYVGDTKFHELFDSKKIFGARAFPRARAQNILPPMPKNMIFEFSQRCEIRRAPRAEVRARQKFFWNRKVYDKISLQIFLFGHNSKSKFFRAIWSLNFFLKMSFSW